MIGGKCNNQPKTAEEYVEKFNKVMTDWKMIKLTVEDINYNKDLCLAVVGFLFQLLLQAFLMPMTDHDYEHDEGISNFIESRNFVRNIRKNCY